MTASSKLLVIQVAGLGDDIVRRHNLACAGLAFQPLRTIFPALTCPVQASFRTAALPVAHGILANGFYDRALRRPTFWEQSATLVAGPRIWDHFRKRGRKVALLFWQNSLGENADIILSPAPIHKHHGGMIEDCYGQPAGLYERLCRRVGRSFRLAHYWGPFASVRSSQWIAEATAALLTDPELAPDLCLTYLPALDYNFQRHGPYAPASVQAVAALRGQLAGLVGAAGRAGYELLVFGDYAIAPCAGGPIFPNRILREAGILATRLVKGMLYPDFYASRAFALCDHEVAQVYVRQPDDIPVVHSLLAAVPGIDRVMPGEKNPRAGDLALLAQDGRWLAYPWWTRRAEAPEYAGHVDIHAKPGYDPCELFWGWPPGSVSSNAARICGSHGRADDTRKSCWAGTCLPGNINSLVDLAQNTRDWLETA